MSYRSSQIAAQHKQMMGAMSPGQAIWRRTRPQLRAGYTQVRKPGKPGVNVLKPNVIRKSTPRFPFMAPIHTWQQQLGSPRFNRRPKYQAPQYSTFRPPQQYGGFEWRYNPQVRPRSRQNSSRARRGRNQFSFLDLRGKPMWTMG